MTDKEIIKALECCAGSSPDCTNCPANKYEAGKCFDIVKVQAVSVMNSQQAEIERLQKENISQKKQKVVQTMADCKYYYDEFCVNDKCPMCTDYGPVPDTPDVCKWEDRSYDNEQTTRNSG